MNIRTAHVGSLPKPRALVRARARFADGDLDADGLRTAEQDALSAALAVQAEVGLDECTDGHVGCGDLVGGFALALDGVEPSGPVRVLDHHYAVRPRVVGPVGRRAPVGVAGWRAASSSSARPVRATVPSPYTLALGCLDDHHASRADAVRAFAAAVADEVRDVVAAGADIVQIDEIAIGARAADLAVALETLALVRAAVGPTSRAWIRLAYVDAADVFDDVVTIGFDGIAVACPEPDEPLAKRLRRAPRELDVGLGVVRADDDDIETIDGIVERVRTIAGARERVWIHPDAGLQGRSFTVARAKLEAVVAVARRLADEG